MTGLHRAAAGPRRRTALSAVGTGLSWGFFALVAGLGLAVIGVPLATGSIPLTVITGSMEPALPPGTLIVVRPTPPADIRLGDVLTYQIESGSTKLVSHRVVEVSSVSDGSFRFITKGDANDIADASPVSEAQISGVTWYSVPWIGYVSTAVAGQGRAWLAPLVGFGLLAYAASQVVLGILGARRRAARLTRAAEDPELPVRAELASSR